MTMPATDSPTAAPVPSAVRMAAIQMVSGADLQHNLQQAQSLLREAASAGVKLAVLPENFAVLDTRQMVTIGQQEVATQQIYHFLQQQARSLQLWIVGGSVPYAQRPDGSDIDGKVRSVCWVFDAEGREQGRYDKIHLFDVAVEDAQGRYQESRTFEAGTAPLLVNTPWGKLGVAICYDLRFPELFRLLQVQGADFVALPAAFTAVTGAAHWHVLLRARAIENQCFMVAAGQGGRHSETRETYGHSLLADPWGEVLAELPLGPGVTWADLNLQRLQSVRQRMPVLEHRRLS